MPLPKSCDTFAALPPGTEEKSIVFGKNSDRPGDEVQEVVYFPAADHLPGSMLKCTYIEIDQVPHTYATILSKPSWMWGAEMGANEHNVCIGNEAVWTKLNDSTDSIKKLLGMDLLRLGLERAKTSLEALKTIVSLIDRYGMGGDCSDYIPDLTYHNSFLIADPWEVWVLECAGTTWAAERVISGVRNISNELSIGCKIDLTSDSLEQYSLEKGFWSKDKGPLNFKLAYGLKDGEEGCRFTCGKQLLEMYSTRGEFNETHMFKVLRDKPSGICRSSGSFVTTASQVSVLRKPETGVPSCHWFTGTPDPSVSIFKPFIFVDGIEYPPEIMSLDAQVDKKHKLYCDHESFCGKSEEERSDKGLKRMEETELKYVTCAKEVIKDFTAKQKEAAHIFKAAVKEELEIYSSL